MQDFDFDGFFDSIDTLDDGMQASDDYTDGRGATTLLLPDEY